MLTRDKIPSNRRFDNPVRVIVRDVTRSQNDKVDYEITVEDGDGHLLPLKIWTTHDLNLSFTEGHQYELSEALGQSRTTNGEREYRLSSTADLTVTDLGPCGDDATRLLLVGDTHVGYRHRQEGNKVDGTTQLDARESFRAVMEQARSLGVDGVVHAGDIFDHGATGNDRSFVVDCLTDEFAEIPFHYLYGNHDADASRKTLDNATARKQHCTRLSANRSPTQVGDVTLFGIDHLHHGFPGEPLEMTMDALQLGANVLVVHDTPYPVRDDEHRFIHEKRGADFREALGQTDVIVDLIVSGHMHVGREGTLNHAADTPVLVTGAPAPINKGKKDNNPSTWLLRVTENGVEGIERQPLRE